MESKEAATLLGERGAARWAAEAFALCCEWNVDLDREGPGAAQSDFRAFLGWRRRYLAALGEHGWIDRAQIAGFLEAVDAPAPQRLILADLEEATPRQSALFARLQRDGARIERWSAPETSAVRLRVRLADARDELRTAIAWARRWIAATPNARVALVVPALDERRAELERALDEPVAHGSALEDAAVPLWHGGQTLAESPRVGAALDALSLGTESAGFETLSRWLRSPFFAAPNEHSARTALERELRRDVLAQLRFSVAYREAELQALLQGAAPRSAASLAAALRATQGIERTTPSGWALAWQRALAGLEWSGAADSDDSLRWQAALDALLAAHSDLGRDSSNGGARGAASGARSAGARTVARARHSRARAHRRRRPGLRRGVAHGLHGSELARARPRQSAPAARSAASPRDAVELAAGRARALGARARAALPTRQDPRRQLARARL